MSELEGARRLNIDELGQPIPGDGSLKARRLARQVWASPTFEPSDMASGSGKVYLGTFSST